DPEAREPLRVLRAHLNPLDARAARALATEADHALHGLRLALEDRLHRAVGVVANPPGHAPRRRHAPRRVAEEHALDPPADDDPPPDHRRRLLVVLVVVVAGRLGGEPPAVELVGADGRRLDR